MSRSLGLALVSLMIVTTACGDSSSADLEDYFATVDQVRAELDAANDAAVQELAGRAAEEGDLADAVDMQQEFMNAVATAVDAAMARLEGVDPPDDVARAHSLFTETGRDVATAFREVSAGLTDATTPQELQGLIADPRIDFAFDGFGEACFELQRIATEADLDVALSCG